MTRGALSMLCVLVGTIAGGCDDSSGDPAPPAPSIDEALVGDWWETYHVYLTTDVGPMFRWTFNSDGAGQLTCSTALIGNECDTMDVRRFDWSVSSEGQLEIDVRPLPDGTDYLPEYWAYTVSGDTVEMTNRDALENLTTLRLSRTAP